MNCHLQWMPDVYRGAEGRTKMKPLKHKAADYVSYVILLAYLAIVILLRIFLPIW